MCMNFFKLKIFILLFAVPSVVFSQMSDYPMRIYNVNSNGNIQLVGGDPVFVIRCFESDFGKPTEAEEVEMPEPRDPDKTRYATKVQWVNFVNKKWSNAGCTLSLIYGVGLHPDYGDIVDPIVYMIIECRDANGKNLLAKASKSKGEVEKYIKEKLFHGFAFVNSLNGVNVRKEPSLTSSIIYKCKDQSKIILKETTNVWVEIKENNKTINTRWVKVFINTTVTGYIPEIFLIPWHGIHPQKLDDIDNMDYRDSINKKYFYYTSKPDVYERNEYDNREAKPNIGYLNTYKDTIHKFLNLELVNYEIYRNKKIANRYTLDTRKVGVAASPTSGYVYDSSHSIKLPVNGGKDSIHIQDEPAEYPRICSYVGRIPVFNKYVANCYSFGKYYILYDMKTGKPNYEDFKGIPYISPRGKYIVDFVHASDPEIYDDPHACILSVSEVDENYKIKNKFTLVFLSWLPDETPNSAFWVSDDEIVIKAFSINTNFSYAGFSEDGTAIERVNYEYIKLTILNR
jgi:hypothetical protein